MTDSIKTRAEFDALWLESGLIDDPTTSETEAAFKGYRLALYRSNAAQPEVERDKLRAMQAKAVMPLIGSLLDAYQGVPNDMRGELTELDAALRRINTAMESAGDDFYTAQPEAASAVCRHEWVRRTKGEPWLVCERCGCDYPGGQEATQPAPMPVAWMLESCPDINSKTMTMLKRTEEEARYAHYHFQGSTLTPLYAALPPSQPEQGNVEWPTDAAFRLGDYVSKKGRASWRGKIVGWYRTELTALGYAVESYHEIGSVQIYPESALIPWEPTPSQPEQVLTAIDLYDALQIIDEHKERPRTGMLKAFKMLQSRIVTSINKGNENG